MFGLLLFIVGIVLALVLLYGIVMLAGVAGVLAYGVVHVIANGVVWCSKEIYRFSKMRTWAELRSRLYDYAMAYPNYCKRYQAEQEAKELAERRRSYETPYVRWYD